MKIYFLSSLVILIIIQLFIHLKSKKQVKISELKEYFNKLNQKFLTISILTSPRKNNEIFLLNTIDSLLNEFKTFNYKFINKKIEILIVNHFNGKHEILEVSRRIYKKEIESGLITIIDKPYIPNFKKIVNLLII